MYTVQGNGVSNLYQPATQLLPQTIKWQNIANPLNNGLTTVSTAPQPLTAPCEHQKPTTIINAVFKGLALVVEKMSSWFGIQSTPQESALPAVVSGNTSQTTATQSVDKEAIWNKIESGVEQVSEWIDKGSELIGLFNIGAGALGKVVSRALGPIASGATKVMDFGKSVLNKLF